MNEKQLYEFWKKYIDVSIYRVVPKCDLKDIELNGIDPRRDPYKIIKKDVEILLRIVTKLEKEGNDLHVFWGKKKVSFTRSLQVTLGDFEIACIDFAPNKGAIDYYLGYKGGAATHNLRQILEILAKMKLNLSKKEKLSIMKIQEFIDKRFCDNVALIFNGSSKLFEKALFQRIKIKKVNGKSVFHQYFESPFGDFEHFKKFTDKNDLRKYVYYLRTKSFYLRIKDKVPASEIEVESEKT